MSEFEPARLEKLDALRAEGVDPYPVSKDLSHRLLEILRIGADLSAEELEAQTTVYRVAGRIVQKNEMGKIGFAFIEDGESRMQLFVRRAGIGPVMYADVWKKLDIGDWVYAEAQLIRTRRGDLSLKVDSLALYSKCIKSLPDKHAGFTDVEQQRRQRYLDLIVSQDTRDRFRARSTIVSYIRRYFEDHRFMEVETPMMQTLPGGANARPFVTHHNALDKDLYLRIAPELYLKRLIVGGYERVFELNRNFRNEGVDGTHNPEFTMLEFYQAHATPADLMDTTEAIIRGANNRVIYEEACRVGEFLPMDVCTYDGHELDLTTFRRVSMADLIREHAGINDPFSMPEMRSRWVQDHPDATKLPRTIGRWFQLYFDEYVEDKLIQPTFVTGFPLDISPLSRASADDPEVADRFELYIAGMEIANGFQELNDPVEQAARFQAQAAAKARGDDEAMYFDQDYIDALSFGMPPTSGEGVGIDRLVMLLTDTQSIRDVILFPTMR